MLTSIHLKNFTIVDELDIEFDNGLSVLTGETGAGKSIWIDAVQLALGGRADNDYIRHSEKRCEITISFDISNNDKARAWLNENELDNEDHECIIRRTLNRDGASRSTINGAPTPLQSLRQLAALLLSIHSQHQHQALLAKDMQRRTLDAFAGNNDLLLEIQSIFQRWRETEKNIEQLKLQLPSRDAELELLKYQHNELSALNVDPDEWVALSKKHQQLHNAQDLMKQLHAVLDRIAEHEQYSAHDMVQQAINDISPIANDDPKLKSAYELLSSAAINIEEATLELKYFRDHLDLSPENLHSVETRLTAIHDMARKHHVAPNELLDVGKSIEQKISELEAIDERLDVLEQAREQFVGQYKKLANRVSERRKKSAAKLNKMITEQMQILGIEGGELKIQLIDNDVAVSATGNESIEFHIKTNPGQPLAPMNKIVSGGELSRISLALLVATAHQAEIKSLIFDEVDVGISGKTAAIVGNLLRELGEHCQVLCITHLPQVAARGQQHYRIAKTATKDKTSSRIDQLSEAQRVEEIARMLSGSEMTKQTRAHAQEMLQGA